MSTVGKLTCEAHPDTHDGIWNESSVSVEWRVVKRDGSNNLTYADNNTVLPVGVITESGVAQYSKCPMVTIHGKEVYFIAGAAVPSDGTTWPWVQATTDGKVVAYVEGAGKYACGYLKEAASGANKYVVGVFHPCIPDLS